MRLKISDGDLLFVSYPKDTSDQGKKLLSKAINDWCKGKGLNNVDSYLVASAIDSGISFSVLSVNDVFEETVLKE